MGFHSLLVSWILLISFALAGCHTLAEQEADDQRKQKLLETELALVTEHINKGQFALALNSVKRLTREYPKENEVLTMTGMTYLALGNPATAEKYFRITHQKQNSAQSALNLSSALLSQGKYHPARKVLFPFLKDHSYPHLERILHNYALVFEKMEKKTKAITFYKKALEENPAYYLSSLRLGQIYKEQGQLQLSANQYEKALKYCSICYEAVERLVPHYLDEQKPHLAVETLKRFIANKNAQPNEVTRARRLLSLIKSNKKF